MSFIQTPSTKEGMLAKAQTIFDMCISKKRLEFIPIIENCKAMIVSKVSYSEINKILNGVYTKIIQ